VSDCRFQPDRRDVLLLMGAAAISPLLPADAAYAAANAMTLGRNQSFDLDWRFFRGKGEGWEAPGFDDAAWRCVDLPHDWSIEDLPDPAPPHRIGPFDETAPGGSSTGYAMGGEGWYRKHFRLPDLPAGARAEILFDGVCAVSDVWLNGHLLGTHVHGYTPFSYDLTPYLSADGDNLIAVRVRNIGETTRFYSGSGLYRPVTLDLFPEPSRIARWGVAAWTRRITTASGAVEVTTDISDLAAGLSLRTRLRSASGKIAAEACSPAQSGVRQVLHVRDPKLWAPGHPDLYTLESELLRGTRVVDRVTQPFGIRIVAFSAKDGLTINGQNIKIRGGCVHHDNGLLGAAAFADADERRVLRLKDRGFNAIRSSHYPCSRTFRDACDRHGMLLIEEAFDMWFMHKSPDDYAQYFSEHWRDDLAAMVMSARNSPSVILWSIGNEIPGRAQREGVECSWRLANEVHRLDPTRPVTAAVHSFSGRLVTASERTARPGRAGKAEEASMIFLDVPGYNYKLDDIERDHARYPERILYASETFPKNAYEYWELGQRAPYFAGEFVWTAMDYLGEVGIGAAPRVAAPHDGAALQPLPFLRSFPWIVSHCGDIDLIGDPKPQSRFRDVVWGLSPLEIAVQRPVPAGQIEVITRWGWSDELQSWTWPASESRPLAVRVYSSADRVELNLNGVVVGTKALTSADKMRADFSVPYAPGALEAVAYRHGVEVARKRLETASAPARLRVSAERARARCHRQALSYFAVDVLDAQGRLVPDAMIGIQLAVEGPAELIGFGSANPQAVGSFQHNITQTYRGRALAILRAKGSHGAVRVTIGGDGLEMGQASAVLV